MQFTNAEELMRLCGPIDYLFLGFDDVALSGEMALRGAHTTQGDLQSLSEYIGFECVVVDVHLRLGADSLQGTLLSLRKLRARWLVVKFVGCASDIEAGAGRALRSGWETSAISAGYRLALQCATVSRYQGDQNPSKAPTFLAFERIPDDALSVWPSEKIVGATGTAVDMSREASARSDAVLARYALASTLIRPGDTVLDCLCGPGYGTALMSAQSTGSRFIGIDPRAYVIDYATGNFSKQYGSEYLVACLDSLSGIADDTIDLIVAFQTAESLPDYEAFMREARRVLKPDGRIVTSVHATLDSPSVDGKQEATSVQYATALINHFLLEERWAQTAPYSQRNPLAPRSLVRLAPDAQPQQAEWIILIASVDPLVNAAADPYRHPEFGASEQGTPTLVAFGDHYENPWLYRTMVQLGERIRDREVLTDLAARVLQTYGIESADFGAALTVIGYTLIERPDSPFVEDVRSLVAQYLEVSSTNPHVKRWQISSAYMAARLCLAQGHFAEASAFLSRVAAADFLAFSPLLGTKVIAANFYLAMMALARGAQEDALTFLQAGTKACRMALSAGDTAAIGESSSPLPFGFTELAEVADMGAQCAMAIKLLPLYSRSPGYFWQKIDTKRFGVVSWAQALERENAALRARGPM